LIDANQYVTQILVIPDTEKRASRGIRNKLFLSFTGHEKAQLWA
jgi:hypothetical protein